MSVMQDEATIHGNSDFEKGLGVMMDNHQNMSSQSVAVTKRANAVLGCINGYLEWE